MQKGVCEMWWQLGVCKILTLMGVRVGLNKVYIVGCFEMLASCYEALDR